MADKEKRQWEKEYKKCMSSPHYFYTNYVVIQGPEGKVKPTTRMTEEEFNKAFYGKEKKFMGNSNR